MTGRRVVVVTEDALGARMAGPAIRAWHMAEALARAGHDVRLLTLSTVADLRHERFAVSRTGPTALAEAAARADVVVVQGHVLDRCPPLAASPAVLVVDLYDPLHLEQLEQARDLGPAGRREAMRAATVTVNAQLARGDFFLCASAKQRDFWLGQLAALGRVNTVVYDADPTLRALIDVVPFGTPDEPPQRRRPAVKGVLPGIAADDQVVLWGGGVYNWFDPLTLVEAVHRLRERHPRLRLLFLGMTHPNPAVPEMAVAAALRRRCDELGLTGTVVHLNEQWVPYDERADWLLDADVGASTHHDHVETAFSFRTRVLDYLWAGLPVLTTRGDTLGDLVEARGLGLTVAAGDVDGAAGALDRLLSDGRFRAQCRANVTRLRPELTWSSALGPLLAFCAEPTPAPDRVDGEVLRGTRAPLRHPRASTRSPRVSP
ncbi:MAG TPA: glycosyltransferase, partial [Mycobacteriales bacterium]|nr:glycosyltransferase [Mycobacteriales bacterium]